MKALTDTLHIGSLALDGRIIMPPMGTYQCSEEGLVTDTVIDYYRARAQNPNVALIITEHSYITDRGKAKARQLSIASDSCIPGLTRLVAAIHAGGAKAFAQLNHAGSAAPREVIGTQALAPSAIPLPMTPKMGDPEPGEMSVEDMTKVVTAFVAAARRAKSAGYDGVEIHSAHGYLLNQFFSPLTNKRTDAYGGSLENRLRLLRETIRAVRAAVGPDYPIAVRLGGCDYTEGGNTIDDAVAAGKILAQEDIQLLDLTGGMNRYLIKGRTEPGYFADMSEAVKEAIDLPVLVTGGVKTRADAQRLIDENAADLIGVGRMLMKDAAWETT